MAIILYKCIRHVRFSAIQQTRRLSIGSSQTVNTPPKTVLLTSANLNSYKDTTAPTTKQLDYANKYFTSQSPQFLFSTATFREFPTSSTPEIAFLGRSNVGKSSLLNTLFNRPRSKLAFVSKRPGRTKSMNVFGIGGASEGGVRRVAKPGMSLEMMEEAGENMKKSSEARNFIGRGGIVVVDCPGYGYASRGEWGREVVKYLQGRKQLRRTFVLIDAVHGVKSTDEQILRVLRESGTPHQIILSKADRILRLDSKNPSLERLNRDLDRLQKRFEEIRLKVQPTGSRDNGVSSDMLCCSAEKSIERDRRRIQLGIDEVRWAILQATGLECDESGRRKALDMDILNEEVEDDRVISWESLPSR